MLRVTATMPHHAFLLLIILFGLIFVSSAQSPETTPEGTPEATLDAESTPDGTACPAIVENAITLTEVGCEGTGLNQACYGHLVLDAEARSGASELDFGEPGDIIDLVEVASLRLSAMDVLTGQWGVVLLQLEPFVAEDDSGPIFPEATPLPEATEMPVEDQAATILLFGDVELEDAVQFLSVTATAEVNIRERPSIDSPVLGTLGESEALTANGRLESGGWVRVRLPEELGSVGWIAEDLLEVQGDPETLLTITEEQAFSDTPDELAEFGPMQAFYFRTGDEDAPCAEAPDSAMLVQTPEGVASVNLWMDEVVVQLDGTAHVQADAGGELTLSVLDGTAEVTLDGQTRTVVAGQQVGVELDESLSPAGPLSDPEAYDLDELGSLPLGLLPEEVTPAAPLTLAPGTPVAGRWRFTWGVESETCPDGTVIPFVSSGELAEIRVTAEGLTLGGIPYDLVTPGIYSGSYVDGSGTLHQDTLSVVASDRILGESVLDLISPVCTLNVPFALTLVSAE